MIELAGREAHVALGDAEHVLAIKLRGRHRARVHMPHALRHAGRAGRIEPERDLVARCLGRRRRALRLEQFAEIRILRGRIADQHQRFERKARHRGLGDFQERRRDEQRLGARILEDVAELLDRQQRVERDRNDPGADRAPEQHREIDRVEHDHRDAVFALQPKPRQHRADARAAVGKLAIGQAPRRIDEGGLGAAALRDIAVDHVERGVVAFHWHFPAGGFSSL